MDDHKIDVMPGGIDPENTRLIRAFGEAIANNDGDEAARLEKLILFRPESLMAIKKALGAAHIRRRGYRTDLADARYGHDWLDR